MRQEYKGKREKRRKNSDKGDIEVKGIKKI
jgi:hypothetical protein